MGKVQWSSDGYYLYGLIEPNSGANFFYEFSHMDSTCFEVYLREFALAYPGDLHIIQLDNGPLHKAKKLRIPPNILLLFQPAHSPQLNPIERRLRGLCCKNWRWSGKSSICTYCLKPVLPCL